MRVRIGTYWLAGDPTKSERRHSSALIQYLPSRDQQEQKGHGWTHARFVDRGNAKWDISFETTRLFNSYAETTAFILGYGSAHAWSGTVVFCEDLGDGTWQEYNLTGAVIEMPPLLPVGVSLRLRYSVRGEKYEPGIISSIHAVLDQSGSPISDQSGNPIMDQTLP